MSGKFSEVDAIIDKLNQDLANISNWASCNGLTIKAGKTQAMWVGSRLYISRLNTQVHREISLNQIIIEPHDSLKVLGVTIYSTLSWREQCNNTAKKTFGVLARLRRCQGYLPDSTKLILIKSLVFPYLDYCAGIFLDLSNELVLKLSGCKNAALRFATGIKKFEHISHVYAEKEILSYGPRGDYLAMSSRFDH